MTDPIIRRDIVGEMATGPFRRAEANMIWNLLVGRLSAMDAGFISSALTELEGTQLIDRTPTSDPVAAARDVDGLWVHDFYRCQPTTACLVPAGLQDAAAEAGERIRQQARAALAAQVAGLRASLKEVLDRIDYINGYDARAVLERARAVLAASPEPASPEPWNDAEVQAWLLRLTNHSGATAEVRDAALVLHDWIKP